MKNFIVSLLLGVSLISGAHADSVSAGVAVNRTGLALLQVLGAKRPSENIIISPYSIETALAMMSRGAAGETLQEMRAVLGLGDDEGAIADSLQGINRALERDAQRSEKLSGQYGSLNSWHRGVLSWSLANRLFGDSRFQVHPDFVSFLQSRYGGQLEAVDFQGGVEVVRRGINGWVEDQTKSRIKDIIPSGGLSRQTTLVLVNALYLKVPWLVEFDASMTRPLPFYLRDGEMASVPTMRQTTELGYAEHPRFAVVTVPFRFGGLRAVFLLPERGGSAFDLLKQLTPADFAGLAADIQLIDLTLPKFVVPGKTIDISFPLQELGLKRLFNIPLGSADLSRLFAGTGAPSAINSIFHQTYTAIDEGGVEAAAATAGGALGAAPFKKPQPRRVMINRPFIFAIQHEESGACLFLGIISNPQANEGR